MDVKTKLQVKREEKGLSVNDLAERSSQVGECGCAGHMRLVINYIETKQGMCSKPRKTYEWACISRVLKCTVDEIYEKDEKI